jgi:hypothetical protein
MRTIYSSTCPRFTDTKAISKAKWNQILTTGATPTRISGSVYYDNTALTFHDTKASILQKILQAECDDPGVIVI